MWCGTGLFSIASSYMCETECCPEHGLNLSNVLHLYTKTWKISIIFFVLLLIKNFELCIWGGTILFFIDFICERWKFINHMTAFLQVCWNLKKFFWVLLNELSNSCYLFFCFQFLTFISKDKINFLVGGVKIQSPIILRTAAVRLFKSLQPVKIIYIYKIAVSFKSFHL